MDEAFLEAWNDSILMVPWLLGIYIFLEFFERKYEHLITSRLGKASRTAPLLGAFFGCIPQCGFSVIAATLYSQRVISRGALLAVFLSTSDEAIPVILAQTDKWPAIVSILSAKIIIATTAGYAVDFFSQRSVPKIPGTAHDPLSCQDRHSHCCGRDHSCQEPWWKSFLLFPLKHTLRVFAFVLLVSFALNLILSRAGSEGFSKLFLSHSFFQPVTTVLIGLIPNCAASVAIAEVFLKGGITFGSAIAGLCASAGFGALVLIRENKNWKDTLTLFVLLAGVSLSAGVILNLIFP